MTLNHSIHALMVGMSENWWRAGIMPCVRSDLERDKPVAYIFWLVEGPNGPVVVDTGYHPDYVAPEWAKGKNFIDAPTLLRELGVKAEEIKTVIVTHFHQDHFTGFDYFPSAKFVMQRAELDFWTGPLMRHEIFDRQIRPKVRPALERLRQEGRIELIDGDVELYPGLELLKAGGHTLDRRWWLCKRRPARPSSAATSRTLIKIFAIVTRWVGITIWAILWLRSNALFPRHSA
jgi:Metal-dependent hydrolases of the beta-lactamase superfamily II